MSLLYHHLPESEVDAPEAQSLSWLSMSQLVASHSEGRGKSPIVGREISAIRRVKKYLLDNLAEKVSLHDLSKVAGLSSFHLTRVFRKETGLPPHAFLINARIEKAKKLLAEGWSIAQTAYETGFTDQSHFTRQFKRTVGTTPKNYTEDRNRMNAPFPTRNGSER